MAVDTDSHCNAASWPTCRLAGRAGNGKIASVSGRYYAMDRGSTGIVKRRNTLPLSTARQSCRQRRRGHRGIPWQTRPDESVPPASPVRAAARRMATPSSLTNFRPDRCLLMTYPHPATMRSMALVPRRPRVSELCLAWPNTMPPCPTARSPSACGAEERSGAAPVREWQDLGCVLLRPRSTLTSPLLQRRREAPHEGEVRTAA